MQGQLSPPSSESAPSKEDVLLVDKTLVGVRIRQSASDRNSIGFISSSACGESSLTHAIIGLPITTVAVSSVFSSNIPLLSLCSHHVSTRRV